MLDLQIITSLITIEVFFRHWESAPRKQELLLLSYALSARLLSIHPPPDLSPAPLFPILWNVFHVLRHTFHISSVWCGTRSISPLRPLRYWNVPGHHPALQSAYYIFNLLARHLSNSHPLCIPHPQDRAVRFSIIGVRRAASGQNQSSARSLPKHHRAPPLCSSDAHS